MYRFPCIHAIRRPNISLTFRIAVRIRIAELPRITMSTTTFTRHNPAVARSCAWLSSCRPRGSCGSMIRVRIVPARRLHHAITSFRLDTACASLARLLARWRLASRKPRDWNGGSDRPARATKESKTKTLEHEAQLARDTQPFRHASTLKGTHMHARVPIAYEMTRPSPTPPPRVSDTPSPPRHQGIPTTLSVKHILRRSVPLLRSACSCALLDEPWITGAR